NRMDHQTTASQKIQIAPAFRSPARFVKVKISHTLKKNNSACVHSIRARRAHTWSIESASVMPPASRALESVLRELLRSTTRSDADRRAIERECAAETHSQVGLNDTSSQRNGCGVVAGWNNRWVVQNEEVDLVQPHEAPCEAGIERSKLGWRIP